MTGHAFPDINESHAYWLTEKTHIKVLMQILKVHLWTVEEKYSSAREKVRFLKPIKQKLWLTYLGCEYVKLTNHKASNYLTKFDKKNV